MARLIFLFILAVVIITIVAIQPSHTNDQIYSLLNVNQPNFSKTEVYLEVATGILALIFIFVLMYE